MRGPLDSSSRSRLDDHALPHLRRLPVRVRRTAALRAIGAPWQRRHPRRTHHRSRGAAKNRCREPGMRQQAQPRPLTHQPARPRLLLELPLPLISAIRPGSFSKNYQSWRRCRALRRLGIRRSASQCAIGLPRATTGRLRLSRSQPLRRSVAWSPGNLAAQIGTARLLRAPPIRHEHNHPRRTAGEPAMGRACRAL